MSPFILGNPILRIYVIAASPAILKVIRTYPKFALGNVRTTT